MQTMRRGDDPFAIAAYPPVPFPDPAWRDFLRDLEGLGVDPGGADRGTWERFYGHLLGANARTNLTRLTAPEDYLRAHLLDSLAGLLVADVAGARECADLGSGAGYPGLPLAAWLPRSRWTLIDSRGRKVDFLAAVATGFDPARIAARRLRGREARSAAPDLVGRFEAVTARAVGPPERLFPEVEPLLRPGGVLVCYQGPSFDRDDPAARPARGWRLDQVVRAPLPGVDARLLAVYRREGSR